MVLGAFKKTIVLAAVAAAVVSAQDAPFYNEKGILEVGATEALNITGVSGTDNVHLVSHPNAAYISVKFSDVDLAEGDLLIVRSPDNTDGFVYTGKGRGNLGTFASSPIRGTTAVVEYYALGAAGPAKTNYKISGYVRGFTSTLESICGAGDQTRPAKCFTGTTAYTKSQSVARLLIGGRFFCTGWLIGSSGHFMTNEHCIKTAADAAQVDIEFGAESDSCTDLCATSLGCKGTVEATSATFVTNSATIDYALLKLPSTLASKYGYLQFRSSGPVVNERIYIPQHPAGWAKRIVNTVDTGAASTISFVNRMFTRCGNNQVGYLADTQGGSSGSPVLSQTDNLVVALHHCGGCNNLAVDPRIVLSDLTAKGISVPNGAV